LEENHYANVEYKYSEKILPCEKKVKAATRIPQALFCAPGA
jgi:hypothetical protein